jgi:hypothetical protein
VTVGYCSLDWAAGRVEKKQSVYELWVLAICYP